MDKSTPICYLRENDDSNVIIGVVITAEKPNLIPDKYGKKTFAVLSFSVIIMFR